MQFLKNFFAKFKIKNKSAFRHGSYSVAIIAVVIAGVIVLNVLMGILSDRGLLSFDTTSAKTNTMDAENIEYIKTIDKEVTVTVFATEDSYVNGTLNQYSAQNLNIVDNSDYYTQTVNILKQYPQINDKIKVVFQNYFSDKTEKTAEEYPSIFYGDILVEYTDETGKTKNELITYADIYSYSDSTGYVSMGYPYYVDANNIETVLSSTINNLISGETKTIALIGSHSDSSVFTKLYAGTLELNGFKIIEINDGIVQAIPEDVDILAITAPTNDFLASEVNVINEWLDNGGKKGKSLIFVPGASMSKVPVLKQFLAEWGIEYNDGILYQTNSRYYYNKPTNTYFFLNNSDLTAEIAPSSISIMMVGSNLVMKPAYETYGSRTPHVVVSTNDTVTVAPQGVSDDWTPADDAEKAIYPGIIITEEGAIVDNERKTSYVVAFGSQEYIYSSWAQDAGLMNMDVAVNTAMFVSGMNTNKKVFVPKTITTESFAAQLSNAEVSTVNIIFMGIIPIVVTALGIVVWVRRKRR